MLAPQSVFITGTNRGLGLELVKQFLTLESPPKYVFAACRNPAEATDLNNLSEQNVSLSVLSLDVTDVHSIETARSYIASVVGDDGLTLLVNNSAINGRRTFDDVTQDHMMEEYAVNTVGPLMIVKAFHTLLKKAAGNRSDMEMSCNKAAIINVSSLVGSISEDFRIGMYPYRASKAALNMITKCLSMDLKDDGILSAAIHPGWIKTDMGTEKAPLTIEEGGKTVICALEELKGEEMSGVLYSCPKLEVIPF